MKRRIHKSAEKRKGEKNDAQNGSRATTDWNKCGMISKRAPQRNPEGILKTRGATDTRVTRIGRDRSDRDETRESQEKVFRGEKD